MTDKAAPIEFSLQEIATALIKAKGIHDGAWMLSFEFGCTAMYAGPDADQVAPTMMVQILKASLAQAEGSPPALTVDAAVVNPVRRRKASKAG